MYFGCDNPKPEIGSSCSERCFVTGKPPNTIIFFCMSGGLPIGLRRSGWIRIIRETCSVPRTLLAHCRGQLSSSSSSRSQAVDAIKTPPYIHHGTTILNIGSPAPVVSVGKRGRRKGRWTVVDARPCHTLVSEARRQNPTRTRPGRGTVVM